MTSLRSFNNPTPPTAYFVYDGWKFSDKTSDKRKLRCSTSVSARLDWVCSKTNGKTVISKSFAFTLIAGLVVAGLVRAETESKNKSSGREANAASRVLTVRDLSIFTYQPAPTRPIEARSLRDEGLVRLYINQQGVVAA